MLVLFCELVNDPLFFVEITSEPVHDVYFVFGVLDFSQISQVHLIVFHELELPLLSESRNCAFMLLSEFLYSSQVLFDSLDVLSHDIVLCFHLLSHVFLLHCD